MLNLINYFVDDDLASLYFVMPLYPENLESYLLRQGGNISPCVVLQIGIDLVKSLRVIHEAGLTYNNLKPHSIMVIDF